MTPLLVVQGPRLTDGDCARLAQVSGAAGVERIAAGAVRLPGGRDSEALGRLCAELRVDRALVPPTRRLADVGVVAMDMDSTLITIECIDEIADMQGLKPQVAAITASAMRGEIDFPESLRRRVGLLAGLDAAALERVYVERLRLSPGAEAMLEAFRAAGASTLLVSGGFTYFTDRLQARLGLDRTVANTLEIEGGRLTGRVAGAVVDAAAKAAALQAMPRAAGKIAVAIGDGANDLPLLAAADVSIAYHAKPVVRERATHALDWCGLDGVVNLFNP